jgi:hypothetical protein
MRYIGINNLYYKHEGFGTLMSHYASMYSIFLDTGIIPAIPKMSNKFQNNSAMEFFNKFPNAQDHFDVFINFNSIFKHIDEQEYNTIDWKMLNFSGTKYDKIINFIQKNSMLNIDCYWSLGQDLFWHHIDKIKNHLFVFNEDILNSSRTLLPQTEKSIVAVCMRNEYINSNHPHTRLSLNYYINAMDQFDKKNNKFLIFSDNIEQSKEILSVLDDSYDILYTNPMPSALGICLMSICNHIINANSSFCYWASLLNNNENKKIICSTNYIDPNRNYALAQASNYKWYPQDWIALDIV